MTRLLAIAVGICVIGIVFTSLAYKEHDIAGSKMHGQVSWVNPDGSQGVVSEGANARIHERNDRPWVNPDGSNGTTGVSDGERLLTERLFWMNPDGVGGTINEATDGGNRRSTSLAARH